MVATPSRSAKYRNRQSSASSSASRSGRKHSRTSPSSADSASSSEAIPLQVDRETVNPQGGNPSIVPMVSGGLKEGDRCYYASPTNTARIKAIDGQEATIELDHGKTVTVALKHCEPLTDAHIRDARLLEKGAIVRGEDLNGQAHTGAFMSLSNSGMAIVESDGKRRLLIAGTLMQVTSPAGDKSEPQSSIVPDNIQPDVIEPQPESITSTIDTEIDRLYNEAAEAQQTAEVASKAAARLYFELGEKLIARKAELKHGQWLPYLTERGIPEHTAQRAMRVAVHFGEIRHVLDLSLNEALRQARQAKLPASPKNEQLSLVPAIEGQTITPGQELFFNNLPCKVIRVNGDWLHVQFIDTGRYTNLERDRFTLYPVEINPAVVRSCPTCKHCESSGSAWYCQKFQQYYTEDENPAPKCEQYSEGPAEKPALPAQPASSPIALSPIERRDYCAGETIEMGGQSLQVQIFGSDGVTAVDASGRPHRLSFKREEQSEKPTRPGPTSAPLRPPALERSIELLGEWLSPDEIKVHQKATEQAIYKLGSLPVALMAIAEADHDDLLEIQAFLAAQIEEGEWV